MAPAPPSTTSRVAYLDSIRGVAALVVVLTHFVPAFFPRMVDGKSPGPNWQLLFAHTPLHLFEGGTFAVYVFFVLSGYVLARSTDRLPVAFADLVVLRYLRLVVPILIAVLFAWALIRLGLQRRPELFALTGNPFERWEMVQYPLAQAIWEAFGGVFVSGQSYYDDVLWTMQPELVGSLLIYATYSVFRSSMRPRYVVFGVMTSIICGTAIHYAMYVCFFAGAVLYQLDLADRIRKMPLLVAVAAIACGLFLGGYPFGTIPSGTVYAPVRDLFAFLHISSLLLPLGAMLFVYGVSAIPALRQWLDRPSLRLLGAISFPVYLLHVPLMQSVMFGLYLDFDAIHHPWRFLPAALIYAVVLFGASFLMWRRIDAPLLEVIRRAKIGSQKWHAARDARRLSPITARLEQAGAP